MNKIYLIHCWSGSINDGWYPWLNEKLNNEIIMQNMPDADNPQIEKWVQAIESKVTNLDENTYFIGHSIGCQTIMRYLETKDTTKIGGILFVAPWLNLKEENLEEGADEIAYEWINTPIDFNKIKEFTNKITCLFSDNDYYVSMDEEKKFKELLGAKTVILNNQGHISAEDGINSSPIILEELIQLMKDKEV